MTQARENTKHVRAHQYVKMGLACFSSSFCCRYLGSRARYLGSLPDLITPRRLHACSTFLTSRGEQVAISTFLLYIFLQSRLNCLLQYQCVLVFQPGLACCWRFQRLASIKHRVVYSGNDKMDTWRKSSQVKIIFNLFESIIAIIATVIIIL